MKNTILLSIFFITFILVNKKTYAQKIEYSYSNSGNRTMRKFNVNAFRVGNQDSTASSDEFKKIVMREGISVYPNPANEKVTLTFNQFESNDKGSVSIIDAKGNELARNIISQKQTEIDISHLSSGVYYYKVVKNNDVLIYKIVKVE